MLKITFVKKDYVLSDSKVWDFYLFYIRLSWSSCPKSLPMVHRKLRESSLLFQQIEARNSGKRGTEVLISPTLFGDIWNF